MINRAYVLNKLICREFETKYYSLQKANITEKKMILKVILFFKE